MGQEEVLTVLKKHKHQWLNSRQIASFVSSGKGSVQVCLRILYYTGDIERTGDMYNKNHMGYLYKYKK